MYNKLAETLKLRQGPTRSPSLLLHATMLQIPLLTTAATSNGSRTNTTIAAHEMHPAFRYTLSVCTCCTYYFKKSCYYCQQCAMCFCRRFVVSHMHHSSLQNSRSSSGLCSSNSSSDKYASRYSFLLRRYECPKHLYN
jgi:hypothetical protein